MPVEKNVFKKNDWLLGIEVKVPAEDFKKEEEEQLKIYQQETIIPGFRKGKAPKEIIRRRFKKSIETDVIEKLVNEVYKETINENNYKPISMAKLTHWNILDNKELRFGIEVEIEPEFKLSNYKGLKVSKEIRFDMEKEMQERLTKLREAHSIYRTVEKAANRGDFLRVDYSVYDANGKKISKTKNVLIECGASDNFSEINQALEGSKKGDVKTVTISYPEDYPDAKLKGKKFEYKFFIHEVKQRELPEVNDEFAKDVGFENLESLKKKIEEGIHKDVEIAIEKNIENQIIEQLVNTNEFEPPPTLVNEMYEWMLRKHSLSHSPETEKELMPQAKDSVKLQLIIKKIAQKEGIEVSDKEIEDEIERRVKTYKIELSKAKNLWRKDWIKETLIMEKTMKFLKENSNITGGTIVSPYSS